MFRQRLCDELPGSFQILFAILGKERRETRLVCEGTSCVVFWLEWVDLSLLERECVCAHQLKHTFHLSISSVSHGFSFLCVDGMIVVACLRELLVTVNTTFLNFAIECSTSVHGPGSYLHKVHKVTHHCPPSSAWLSAARPSSTPRDFDAMSGPHERNACLL